MKRILRPIKPFRGFRVKPKKMGKDKNNKFKTPEGYFEGFHDRLMDRIQSEENPEDTSVIPKSDGFAVPKDYFEQLTEKVVSKAHPKEGKVVQLKSYRNLYYALTGVAAVLLLFFGLTWNSSPEIGFEDLANAEIDAYFEDTDFDLSTFDIAEVVPLEQIELNDVLDHTLPEDNILEYLNENVGDIEDLNLDYDDYE